MLREVRVVTVERHCEFGTILGDRFRENDFMVQKREERVAIDMIHRSRKEQVYHALAHDGSSRQTSLVTQRDVASVGGPMEKGKSP